MMRLAEQAVDAVDACALFGMPGDELIELTAAVESLGRVVDGLRVATATAIERRSDRLLGMEGLAQSFGYRRGFELIEQVTGVSGASARRRIRLGAAANERNGELGSTLPPLFPVVSQALASGQIGVDAARSITEELARVGQRADADDLEVAERVLVAAAAGRPQDIADLTADNLEGAGLSCRDAEDVQPGATSDCPGALPADLVAMQARVWRDALDPDGIEPRADRARFNRAVTISRAPIDGLHVIRGRLTPDVAAAALTYFDSLVVRSGVQFTADDADRRPDAPVELRTYDQQRHDLFAAMVRGAGAAIGTDADLPAPAPLVVSADMDQLRSEAGTGSISGVEGRVPVSYLWQVACDGGVQLLLHRAGKIHLLGTRGRFFTVGQRRAVAVRDGSTCVVPGCRVPFAALEAHHVEEHSRGGRTHVDNCVLVCWWHHHLIDSGVWRIAMVAGKPRIRVPVRARLTLAA